jgi:hypothetical protein
VSNAQFSFTTACEEREKSLLAEIDKYRQQKISNLSDQTMGLRSALGKL